MRYRRLNTGSRSAQLLLALVDELDLLMTFGYAPGKFLTSKMEDIRAFRTANQRRQSLQTLHQLKKRDILQIKKEANNLSFALSQKGAREVLMLRMSAVDRIEGDEVCMVIFDIPESDRPLRKRLRTLLSECCFIPIQKSVWISPFDASDILSQFFTAMGIRGWVRIYRANEVPINVAVK